MKALDKTDRRILAAIETDARRHVSEIARMTNVSRTVAEYRLKNMEKRKIIRGYYCLLDPSKFGFSVWKLWLALNPKPKRKRSELVMFLSENPRVWWYSECSGAYDIVICILCKGPHEFYDFLTLLQSKWGDMITDSVTLINVSFEYHTRGYLLGEKSKLIGTSFQKKPKPHNITPAETEILGILCRNSRTGIAEIARETGRNVKTVRKCIKNLQDSGVIVYFRPSIDASAYGFEYYKVLLYLHNPNVEAQKSISYWCRRHPNIIAVISCVGPWQLELEAEVSSFMDLAKMLTDLRDTFPDTVKRYEALIILNEGNYELDLIRSISKI